MPRLVTPLRGVTPESGALRRELRPISVAATWDLDANTAIEPDSGDGVCAISIEHASERAECPSFSFEQIAA